MTDTAVAQELHALRQAVHMLSQTVHELAITTDRATGSRLTFDQMCERRGVSRSTLTRQIKQGKLPQRGTDGKWLMAEVREWEDMARAQRAAA